MKRIILSLLHILILTPAFAQTRATLAECIAMAREKNKALLSARLSIEQSVEQLGGAEANYGPNVAAQALAFQAFDKIVKSDGTYPQELAALGEINPAFAQMAGQPYSLHELSRAYTLALSAMQPIYAGGKIHTGVKLARLQTEVAELQASMKEKDVVQKVTECYWNIAAQKYYLRTIAAAEKQLAAVHEQVALFVKTGMTTRNALLQVSLRQQEIASKRLKIENGERLLLLLLKQQTGAEAQDFDIAVPDEDALLADMEREASASRFCCREADASRSMASREELQLSAKNVEANRLQIKMKRADMLPTLAVGLMGYHMGMGGFSGAARQYVPTHMTNGLALATLSIPLSPWWGTGKHALRQQKLALRQAEMDYADVSEQLALDTESAWLGVTEARKQIDIAKASVAEADENYRMYSLQYKQSTVTITDFLDAETLSRQAHDDLSANLAAYHIRLADYERKAGAGSERHTDGKME